MATQAQINTYVLLSTYDTLLAAVSAIVLFSFRKLNKPAKFIAICLLLTFVVEFSAFMYYKQNDKWPFILYHFYNPVQFALICLYYHYLLEPFRRKGITPFLIAGTTLFAIVNGLFLQNAVTTPNTYFLNVEAILIIAITLYDFYNYANEDDYEGPVFNFRFLISCILLVFWSFTFVYWLVGLQMNIKDLWYMLLCIAMVTYAAMGVVFLFYNKLKLK